MKNKRVKQMICKGAADSFGAKEADFWWEDGQLMQYHPPCGFNEGDELPFYWYWMKGQITSIKGKVK